MNLWAMSTPAIVDTSSQVLRPNLTSQVPASRENSKLSILHGVADFPLLTITLGGLLDLQATQNGSRECLVVYKSNKRWTYRQLQDYSRSLARGLVAFGLKPGDRVGIMAENCAEYVQVFFAAAYAGCILVVLNNTYTAQEAQYALKHSGCRVLFTTSHLGRQSNEPLLMKIGPYPRETSDYDLLETVVILKGTRPGFLSLEDILAQGRLISPKKFDRICDQVNPHDICNLQYTSGSTGQPKAAMLTHHSMINNAKSIGDRMAFTNRDILCCPPPLFHCFGLVLGLLAVVTHGAKIVLPSPFFDACAVIEAISDEKCTALHGVPTMFEELLKVPRPRNFSCDDLRTGIIAGAPVPRPLMERLFSELNMTEYTSSYGLTETSPTCFNAFTYDSIERRLTTVGTILPHLHAKIVDHEGNIVPVGQRGELCMAGYSLQRGYWNNPEKTAEVMVRDEEGVLWLHTGDEASFDENGYCSITGRFKDIIIRGGENIYPLEIETRLVAHPAISTAAIVGIKDSHYGEVVGAFLQHQPEKDSQGQSLPLPSDDEIRAWTRQVLGWHKAPAHVFWLGDEGVPDALPLTGSGKVRKYQLREIGEKVLKERQAINESPKSKL